MYVVFLYGPPASGKYTIGKLVAEKLGIPLFHNHLTVDLVGSLFAFGTPEFIAMREKIWLDAFNAAASSGQPFVFTFNPENTVAPSTLDKLEFAVSGNAGKILYIGLVCPEDEIERRLGDESRGAFGKLTELELYRRLREEGAFDSPAMPDPLKRIDTSLVTAFDAAELIVSVVLEYTGL